jgi:hypothetical protein
MSTTQKLLTTGVLLAVTAFGQSSGFENVIIRAAKPYDKVIAAIQARGGRVTHQYTYVDALAAQVPVAAMGQIGATNGVTSIGKDALVQRGPGPSSLDTRLLSAGASLQLQADEIQALAPGGVQASSGGASLAGLTVDNTALGLDALFQSGKQGEGVIVAMLDGSIRRGFPIASSVIGGEETIGDGLGWLTDEQNGHGTFVAGSIALHVNAVFANTSATIRALNAYAPGVAKPYDATRSVVPVVGTAPQASLYVIRVFPLNGNYTANSAIMAGMEQVIQLRELYDAGLPGGVNIKVCNMSLGTMTFDPRNDPENQLLDVMLAHDIVPVVAAGNAGPAPLTLGAPDTSRSALSVGGASLAYLERVYAELALGSGQGLRYRPYAGTLMYFASSRGPGADGQVRPDVVANAQLNLGMGYGSNRSLSFESGTSGAAPMVSGVAAVLRQTYPMATARQIRNAIIASGNPNFVDFADVVDRGHGFVNAAAASALLAAGGAPDTLDDLPNTHSSVQVNMEQNTPLRVADGFVRQTFHLRPGQRGDIVYRVAPNTSQVIVTVTNFQGGPLVDEGGVIFGDTLTFGIHSAQTSDFSSDSYISPLEHLRAGTRIVNNPEPGLMRIAVNASWRNDSDVSVDVSVASLTDPIPQFTQQGQVVATQDIYVPFTVPAGTKQANFHLGWKADWGTYPAADLDLYLLSPSGTVNQDGATENNPESVSIQNPEPGGWLARINGFDIPAGSDKYEFRIELDGKVIH